MKKIFLLFSIFFTIRVFGCAVSWTPTYIKEYYYNFIDRSLLESDIKDNPLYIYSNSSIYAYEERVNFYSRIKKDLNLDEWSRYLNISKREAEELVYKKGVNLNIIRDSSKREEFKRYKALLNQIDRYNTNWHRFLKRAKSLYKKSKSKFFKTRIAYNIIRAYHNLGKYREEISFIKSLDRDNSIVWEWIDSYYAGAIQHREDFVKSAYLFSKIFSTHKSDAYIGYYDFKIRTDKEWKSLLKLAKNSEERIVFHFLRAINPNNNELLELEYMSRVDPKSKWTQALLYLVSQKAQYIFYRLMENNYYDEDYIKEGHKRYLNEFLSYLDRYPNSSKLNKFLFSYFKYLKGRERVSIDSKRYQKLLDYLYYIDNLKEPNELETSKRLLDVERSISDSNISYSLKRYTLDRLSKLYPKDSIKEVISSFRDEDYRYMYFNGVDLKRRLTLKNFKELNSLRDKRDKNYIEKLLLELLDYVKLNRDYINLYYGILYTQNMKFKSALEYVKRLKVPTKECLYSYGNWDCKYDKMRVSEYNPFNVSFSGNNRKKSSKKFYTHKKFLETILKIEGALDKNSSSIMDNFLYANGLYNISFFGNSPMFATIFRSPFEIDSNSKTLLDRAEEHYKRVLKATNNSEMRAKVYYQLMKIAFDRELMEYSKKRDFYFITDREMRNLMRNSSNYKRLYYEFLKYKKTKYYKRVKGCATFRYFK